MINKDLYPVARYHLNDSMDVVYIRCLELFLHTFARPENIGLVRSSTFEIVQDFKLEPMMGNSFRYVILWSDGTKEELTNPPGFKSEKYLVYKKG